MNDVQRIDSYLKQRRSPLTGLGANFVTAGRKYGVDPYLLVAISGAESSFGKVTSGSHNPFGWGPGIHFGSWGQAINAVASGLKKGYYDQGRRTINSIGQKWAPIGAGNDPTNLNSNWARNVTKLYKELGGPGVNTQTGVSEAASGAPVSSKSGIQAPDLSQVALSMLSGRQPSGEPMNANDTLQQLALSVASQRQQQQQPSSSPIPPSVRQGQPHVAGDVTLAKGADRSGVATGAKILGFAHRVAGVYGKPLTITTGTQHSKMTVNGRQSAHWTGNAADIAASGSALTAMGRAALIAAGMNPRQAAKTKGGLFNIGGYQIIFNTRQGGNHWNHLHIGVRG